MGPQVQSWVKLLLFLPCHSSFPHHEYLDLRSPSIFRTKGSVPSSGMEIWNAVSIYSHLRLFKQSLPPQPALTTVQSPPKLPRLSSLLEFSYSLHANACALLQVKAPLMQFQPTPRRWRNLWTNDFHSSPVPRPTPSRHMSLIGVYRIVVRAFCLIGRLMPFSNKINGFGKSACWFIQTNFYLAGSLKKMVMQPIEYCNMLATVWIT